MAGEEGGVFVTVAGGRVGDCPGMADGVREGVAVAASVGVGLAVEEGVALGVVVADGTTAVDVGTVTVGAVGAAVSVRVGVTGRGEGLGTDVGEEATAAVPVAAAAVVDAAAIWVAATLVATSDALAVGTGVELGLMIPGSNQMARANRVRSTTPADAIPAHLHRWLTGAFRAAIIRDTV